MITKFIPSQHGFQFSNGFIGYPLPKFIKQIPRISSRLNSSDVLHGLCGGMCFASQDFFLANRTIPMLNEAPRPRDLLYQYLFERQNDSYGFFNQNIVKFAQWMLLSEEELQRRTILELEKLLTQLKKQELVTLGLVTVKFSQTFAMWNNHQVLAYGYQVQNPSSRGSIYQVFVYDPNLAKADDVALIIDLNSEFNFIFKRLNNDKFLRIIYGFFLISYSPISPPSI